MKRLMRYLCLAVLTCAVLLSVSACGSASAKQPDPMTADEVSFTPTVYYANDGIIRFLYNADRDMLSDYGSSDMAVLYSGGSYSFVISYTEGTVADKDAETQITEEFGSSSGLTLSEKATKETVSGYTFHSKTLSADDGSFGAVLYGSTASGYAEIYYLISADAPEDSEQHLKEILSTVALGEYSAEIEADTYDEVYIQQ